MLALYMSFIDDESHRRLFEKIYIEYREQMFFMARSVLGNDSYAEDIVHDVFMKIARKHMTKIGSIENENDLRNYLLTATKYSALNHLHKHRRELISMDAEIEANIRGTVVLSDDAFVEKICNSIEYERILSSIVSMKDIYKEAMYYHFVMDLSVPEVANMLGCKVSTVKQRLVRGKKLLYVQLFGEESNESRK